MYEPTRQVGKAMSYQTANFPHLPFLLPSVENVISYIDHYLDNLPSYFPSFPAYQCSNTRHKSKIFIHFSINLEADLETKRSKQEKMETRNPKKRRWKQEKMTLSPIK